MDTIRYFVMGFARNGYTQCASLSKSAFKSQSNSSDSFHCPSCVVRTLFKEIKSQAVADQLEKQANNISNLRSLVEKLARDVEKIRR